MTGRRGHSTRAVPSALLALVGALLAVFPAGPTHEAAAGRSTIASLAAHHVDAAVVATRGEAPLARHHDTPAVDAAGASALWAPVARPATTGWPGSAAPSPAGVPLPGVRAPPVAA